MQILGTIGSVTLSRCHPSYEGVKLVAAEPLGGQLLGAPASDPPDLTIVWDDLGAGTGVPIAVSDGAEAAQPFRPALKPVDAYCAAILDHIEIDANATSQLNLS